MDLSNLPVSMVSEAVVASLSPRHPLGTDMTIVSGSRTCPQPGSDKPPSSIEPADALSAPQRPANTSLIASERAKSPCFALSQKGLVPKVFSAYGFNARHETAIGFKGEFHITWDGLYLLGNGHRAYSASLMRFISPDQESPFASGGMNAYAFALADPINRSDPSGRTSQLTMALGRALSQKTYRGKIITEFDGIVAFIGGPTRDGQPETLYISAHGAPGKVSGDGKTFYTASKLYQQLDRDIDMSKRPTHFLSCHSSTPTPSSGTSMIQDMSALTGASSSGYPMRVSLTEGKHGDEFIAYKHYAKPLPGITSTKTTVDHIRDPER